MDLRHPDCKARPAVRKEHDISGWRQERIASGCRGAGQLQPGAHVASPSPARAGCLCLPAGAAVSCDEPCCGRLLLLHLVAGGWGVRAVAAASTAATVAVHSNDELQASVAAAPACAPRPRPARSRSCLRVPLQLLFAPACRSRADLSGPGSTSAAGRGHAAGAGQRRARHQLCHCGGQDRPEPDGAGRADVRRLGRGEAGCRDRACGTR